MSTAERKRIPELDGLRVLMIFIVSWFHIWQQSWLGPMVGNYSLDWLVRSGYIWVDGTVFLSAFLLFMPYARAALEGTPLPDTRDFYRRRAIRILPSYYFFLALVFFAVCLPWNLYQGNGPFLVKDVATHLTFTFPFFRDTLLATPLGGACWTLAIEVQAYALFPLVARGALKKPVLTFSVMAAVCFGFRAWCLWALGDWSVVVNQLINFLDVYVIGMLSAAAFVRLSRREERKPSPAWQRILWTLAFAAVFFGLCRLMRYQASAMGDAGIKQRQMLLRPVFALCFAGLSLSAPFSLKPLRLLLGNPVTRFLAGISMNYYLLHQVVAVHLRRIGFPPSVSETPNYAGEQPRQTQYTLLAFGLSLVLAAAVTYGIEKPAARILGRRRKKAE